MADREPPKDAPDHDEERDTVEEGSSSPRTAQIRQGIAQRVPTGFPGLPARPGGLPSLPPRGLAGSLPTRGTTAATGSASSAPPAASKDEPAASASSSSAPSLPARPAGGLGALPPRGLGGAALGGAPRSTASDAAPAPQPTSQSAASTPAAPPSTGAAAPSLPARPAAAGLGASLPARPTPPASGGPSLPARPGTGPSLPARPGAGAGAPPAPTPAAPTPAAAPPSRPAGLGGIPGLGPRPTPAAPAVAAAASQQAVAVPAARPTPTEEIVDPTEPRKIARIQQRVQDLRVTLLRAAGRLGLRFDQEQVQQFMGVINRVEQVNGAGLYKGAGRRVDLAKEAEKTARLLDSREAADSKLDIKVKVLLLGVSGTGKSELINSLLERPAARTNAFSESTKRVRVVKGYVHGIQVEFIDTPGLSASTSRTAENRSILKAVRAAYRWHKPNYVFWVDRLDSGRPPLGELSLLGQINEMLGSGVWKETMVILTHAHASRAAMGPAAYDTFSRQRRNIISQLLRQAAGNQQVRNPMFLVDSHPECPTNSFGQPIIFEGMTAVPWKQALMLQLVGYRLYETCQQLFKEANKGKKTAAAAANKQQDMFRQMMRPRLPPVSFYVEQMCEGVLAPDGWGAMEDPQDNATEDLEAEEFEHAYYRTMYDLACKGEPWAQKEYALMLAKQERLRRTYADAFKGEDIDQLAVAGYEGYVAEGLDLGPTFDPMEGTNHRYVYAVPEADWQIMPTLDFYGFEHDDAISGFVAEWDGQPFNRHGWGGIPINVHLAVEKDKTSACFQGEAQASLVHCVPPFGSRHITQLCGSWEILRPNIKDVLYQLEINSFKDGFLQRDDHAGVGLMVTRLGEGGRVNKGPMGLGVRLQDSMRVGPLHIDACLAKVQTDTAQGGKDEAWGARAFVLYDWLPGVGMLFDFYQQRTKETDAFNIIGTAANFTYDWETQGCACGLEVDYVPGHKQVHVDLNIFSGNSYKPAWLLLLPAWTYVKGLWQSWRQRAGEEEGEFEEGEEGEEDMSGLTQEQQAQIQMQQMLRMMGMGR